MNSYDPFSFGPYPKRDRYKANEALSIEALTAALPKDRFQFRPERQNDEGVDGSIELLTERESLNLRGQAQLKSLEKANTNSDGSISLPVKVSNVNYLLNDLCPIYVLYVVSTNELRFLWARDEEKRLDKIRPGWREVKKAKKGKKVSLRFDRKITKEALDEIYDRICQACLMPRTLHSILSRASVGEQVPISIDPSSLMITDPDEINERLLSSGLTLIDAGFAAQVLDHARLLKQKASQAPRIHLVQAYAQCSQGRYEGALSHLQDVMLLRQELSSDDQEFAACLRDFCEYKSGRIDSVEYERREKKWGEESSSGYALAQLSSAAYRAVLGGADPARINDAIERHQLIVDEILRREDIPRGIKLQARVELLYAERRQLSMRTQQVLLFNRMGQEAATLPVGDVSAITDLQEKWRRMDLEALGLIAEAKTIQNPLLIADALHTHASIVTGLIESLRRADIIADRTFEAPISVIEGAIKEEDAAREIYEQAGSNETATQSKLLIADLLLLADKARDAEHVAREVLRKAEALGYSALAERARAIISGKALFTKYEEAEGERSQDQDVAWAQTSDEELRRFAAFSPRVVQLGNDWLPVMQQTLICQREVSRERVNWCRHIAVVEIPEKYPRDPERKARCEKYNYESAIADRDCASVMLAFKRVYCLECTGRDPKSCG